MIISYELEDSLYINLTNRCSNACNFCLRTDKDAKEADKWETSADLAGTSKLWLEREPTVDEIINDLKKRNLKKYKEVVFCGFGEPFMRFDECVKVAKWLKTHGVKIRVNTNGQANLIHQRDVTPEMAGLFDIVSISLNNKNAKEYNEICRSKYGEKAYDALLDFGKRCSEQGIETIFTVVDILPKEDIAICEQIANSHGGKLRVRKYIKGDSA
ncbi:MAG: TatD family nuclease-associated radical SAM protein [Firmicutes bacterium]|nr:TatD family nuclease-associated radical SAM protein [Bacillota bacterium]